MWPLARDLWVEHPLIGAGAGTFQAVNPLHLYSHNFVLEIGTGMGILGSGLFVGGVIYAMRNDTVAAEPRKRILLVGGFVAVSMPILVSGFWNESPMFWAALALFSRIPAAIPAQPERPPEQGASASSAPVATAVRSPTA
jgi:O-antigen ligase